MHIKLYCIPIQCTSKERIFTFLYEGDHDSIPTCYVLSSDMFNGLSHESLDFNKVKLDVKYQGKRIYK